MKTSGAERDRASGRRDAAIGDRDRVETVGRIAGFLLVAAPLLSITGSLLVESEVESYLLTALMMVTGLVCLAIPWDRISPPWFHAVGVLATLEVGAAVAFVDPAFGAYLVVIAVLVAQGMRSHPTVAGYLAAITAVVLAPIAWEPENARSIAGRALLLVPSAALAAAIVVYVRERLEARQRAYQRFAEEILELTGKIRGTPVLNSIDEPDLGGIAPATAGRPRARARLRVALAALSALLAVPLALASLALAGVELPRVAVDSFEQVGISLPNQREVLSVGGMTGEVIEGGVELSPLPSRKRAEDTPGSGRGRDSRHRAAGGSRGETDHVRAGAPAAVAPSPAEAPAPAPGDNGDGGGAPVQDTLDSVLEQAREQLDRVLPDVGLPLPKPKAGLAEAGGS